MDVDKPTQPDEECRSLPVNLEDYLDDLEIERSALIMKLRRIDQRLQQHGRLKDTHLSGTYVIRSR